MNTDVDPRQVLRNFFWRKCRACTIVGMISAAILVGIATTENLWRPFLDSWGAPLEVELVSPSVVSPRTFEVIVRNRHAQPAVISTVELVVMRATPSRETIAGSSSLPVTEHFDAVLDPFVKGTLTFVRPPFQVEPNDAERFQVRLGTKPYNRSERVDYSLVLRFHVNGDRIVESPPFDARLPTR